jgi:hypothetical protein
MKARDKKPAFLKTFSEFTIAELRAMPLSEICSLFFREVTHTFGSKPKKRSHRVKKNAKKPILIAKVKPTFKLPLVHAPQLHVNTTGFSEAMKRVFTIGPVKADADQPKQGTGKNDENEESETVVFSKSSSVN